MLFLKIRETLCCLLWHFYLHRIRKTFFSDSKEGRHCNSGTGLSVLKREMSRWATTPLIVVVGSSAEVSWTTSNRTKPAPQQSQDIKIESLLGKKNSFAPPKIHSHRTQSLDKGREGGCPCPGGQKLFWWQMQTGYDVLLAPPPLQIVSV